jgi:hypothetical protein
MRFSGETKGIEVAIYNTLRDLVQKAAVRGRSLWTVKWASAS